MKCLLYLTMLGTASLTACQFCPSSFAEWTVTSSWSSMTDVLGRAWQFCGNEAASFRCNGLSKETLLLCSTSTKPYTWKCLLSLLDLWKAQEYHPALATWKWEEHSGSGIWAEMNTRDRVFVQQLWTEYSLQGLQSAKDLAPSPELAKKRFKNHHQLCLFYKSNIYFCF